MTGVELVVLAGGFGTRLKSAVPDVPKPLAPVLDRPYLLFLIENWIRQGVSSMTFTLHHQSDQILAFLDAQRESGVLRGCKVRTVVETEPLGTGGAVAHAIRTLGLDGDFLVANADTWLGSGISLLSRTSTPSIATVLVNNCERYGAIALGPDEVTIASFTEKRSSQGPGWINAGLYHLNAEQFAGWDGKPFSIESGLFPHLVASGKLKAVKLLDADFIDIGVPDDYLRFCRWIESQRTTHL